MKFEPLRFLIIVIVAICQEWPNSGFYVHICLLLSKRIRSQISSAAWWNQEVKEVIRAEKAVFRAWLTNKSSELLQLRYSAAHKTVATFVKQLKEKSRKEFGQKLYSS